MHTALLATIGPAAALLVFAVVVVWDRLREPRRDLYRPVVVVDERTYRDAKRRVDRLTRVGDQTHARYAMHAMCGWLRYEIRTGRASRRVSRAADLEQWEMRLEQTAG